MSTEIVNIRFEIDTGEGAPGGKIRFLANREERGNGQTVEKRQRAINQPDFNINNNDSQGRKFMKVTNLQEIQAGADDKLLVNTEALAWCLHLTPRRITQLAEDGVLIQASSSENDYVPMENTWNLAEAIHDYIDFKLTRRGWRQMR